MKNYSTYLLWAFVLSGSAQTAHCYWYNLINATPFEVSATVKTDHNTWTVDIKPHSVKRVGDGSGFALKDVTAQVKQTYVANESTGDIFDPKRRIASASMVDAHPYSAVLGDLGNNDYVIAGPLYTNNPGLSLRYGDTPGWDYTKAPGLRAPYYVVTRVIN